MFDPFSFSLLENLPKIPELDGAEARRNLSKAYIAIIKIRFHEVELTLEETSAIEYLRRLADTLESRAIFDHDVPILERRSCAFAAAESIALLVEYYDRKLKQLNVKSDELPPPRIKRDNCYTRIEAALLYMYAQFDANAAGILRGMPKALISTHLPSQAAEWCFETLIQFCDLRLNPLPPKLFPQSFIEQPSSQTELVEDTQGRIYGILGEAVSLFMHWLAGENDFQGYELASEKINHLVDTLSTQFIFQSYAPRESVGVLHLAKILQKTFGELASRSLVSRVKTPAGLEAEEYRKYLKHRAIGSEPGRAGRPVLWPSALRYVEQCLEKNIKHAVVSMPTGSGKSFVAELAVSRKVSLGWSLYLAPTNALAQQIRTDLAKGLESLNIEVSSFIGDREYTTLTSGEFQKLSPRTVAVMTPEKCLLALRIAPHIFSNCKLVVFDECHLISERSSGRGTTAELVLSQVMEMTEGKCDFLLMSAIMRNPSELASWIKEATKENCASLEIGWRPTRTLRAAVAIDKKSLDQTYEIAKADLSDMPTHRINKKFTASCLLISSLQGPWRGNQENEYNIVPLPILADMKVSRTIDKRGNSSYSRSSNSWVNRTTESLAQYLATRKIQTLVFIPKNRHFPFSIAAKIDVEGQNTPVPIHAKTLIETCRILAEYEIGKASEVFNLIDRGISVHTAAIVEVEKLASETAFSENVTKLMLATGTLAQGLNLPAIAVIIAGTEIGHNRGNNDSQAVEERKLAQLLNAAGRAGRAGFSNQGLVVAITDHPIALNNRNEISPLRDALPYLQRSDNAIDIKSSLKEFIDDLLSEEFPEEMPNSADLQVLAFLSGGDTNAPPPEKILRRSFAAYKRRHSGSEIEIEQTVRVLIAARSNFLQNFSAPIWVPIAAQRSGLDFWLVLALAKAWFKTEAQINELLLKRTFDDWLVIFISTLSYLPPKYLLRRFSLETLRNMSPKLAEILVQNPDLETESNGDWILPDGWSAAWLNCKNLLIPWMEGESLAEIASKYLNIPIDNVTPSRSSGANPIPKVISLTNNNWGELSIIAGGFVAIVEQVLLSLKAISTQPKNGVPSELGALPLCIKYGFNSQESLAWFRFGVRLRRPAHLLSAAFPMPTGLDEEELRNIVRQKRREWLMNPASIDNEVLTENSTTAAAILSFLKRNPLN